jgi:outer membrane protein OmpA-like peptidoglycan-associated protein
MRRCMIWGGGLFAGIILFLPPVCLSQTTNLGEVVNSHASDFAPVISPDGDILYFTSNREGGEGGQDIWVSSRIDGVWTEPVNLGPPLNGPDNQGPDVFTFDERNIFLYLTLCNREDGVGGCDIYVSIYKNDGTWTAPTNLDVPVNTEFQEANATFDEETQTLFFASTRPGGMGMGTKAALGETSYDIWMSRRNPGGTWDEPVNLGENINTPAWEGVGFFHTASGYLYFSSDGHSGKGGADIFRARKIRENTWSEPEPLDMLNSAGNDFYISIPASGDMAYLSSNREGGFGHEDIYVTPLNLFLDADELKVRAWQLAQSPPPAVPAVGEFVETFRKSFCPTVGVAVAPKPKPGIPPVIYFNFDDAEVQPEAIQILDRWSEYLEANDQQKIEIGGHTCSLGDDLYNLILSKARADAARQYLVDKGISADRLSVAYYGEGKPAVPNDPVKGNPDNRRVEIKLQE